jgi:DNA polymerase-3 subunit delta'
MNHNWDILGNSWAVEMLRGQAARGVPRHAYLMTGPPGVGRRTLANRFAQALNCTQPAEPGIPCETCWECKQISAMKHPDVTFSEADTEGGVLKVGQAREVRGGLSLMPYRAKYRVAVFLRFQEANEEAANALLKTLEEPPASAVLILTADDVQTVLPTIVSRCEVLRLQPAPVQEVAAFLESKGAAPEKARLLAHISEGRPGLAVQMFEKEELVEFRDAKLADLHTLLPATRAQRFAYAKRLSQDKASMRAVLGIWLSFWRDVLWSSANVTSSISNVDRTAEVEALSRKLGLEESRRLVAAMQSGLRQLETNVNRRLLAEVILLDWPR